MPSRDLARSSPRSSAWATIFGSRERLPGLGRERIEGVEKAALDADVLAPVEVEAAAVAVAAVARSLRHRQPPELLAAAEGECAVWSDTGVGQLVRVAAPRSREDDVLVVLARWRRVEKDARAALDDVVELVLPDDLAGERVDAAQIVVVAAHDQLRPAAVDDETGLAGPAAAAPFAGRVVVLLARAPAAAELNLPQHVEAIGHGPKPVEAPGIGAEERTDLDAVALERRHRRGRHGGGADDLIRAASAGADPPDDDEDDDQQDEQDAGAPSLQLAPARRRSARRGAMCETVVAVRTPYYGPPLAAPLNITHSKRRSWRVIGSRH